MALPVLITARVVALPAQVITAKPQEAPHQHGACRSGRLQDSRVEFDLAAASARGFRIWTQHIPTCLSQQALGQTR